MKQFWRFVVVGYVFVWGCTGVFAHGGKDHVLDTSEEGMQAIADALGVKCAHCHTQKDEDGKRDYEAPSAMKETTLYMKHHFVDGLVTREGNAINCAFCHHGQAKFIARDTSAAKPSRLAGMSRNDIVQLMKQMQEALGVKSCDYCHVRGRDGRLDPVVATPNKVIARAMMEQFTDQLLDIRTGKQVTCQTCHQGKATFLPRDGE